MLTMALKSDCDINGDKPSSQINAEGNSNQNITVTAVVSETEMTATQHFINNIQQNSVL